MEIVNLTQELASVASRIYAESWKVAYSGIVPQKYLDDLSADRWTLGLENSPFRNFLLRDNGVFVATSSIVNARDSKYKGYGEIVSIYVLPEYFNKGYGTFLFKRMVEQLRTMGLKKICLWVLEENIKAKRFYTKMGLIPNGDEKTVNVGGKQLTAICYVNEV